MSVSTEGCLMDWFGKQICYQNKYILNIPIIIFKPISNTNESMVVK